MEAEHYNINIPKVLFRKDILCNLFLEKVANLCGLGIQKVFVFWPDMRGFSIITHGILLDLGNT